MGNQEAVNSEFNIRILNTADTLSLFKSDNGSVRTKSTLTMIIPKWALIHAAVVIQKFPRLESKISKTRLVISDLKAGDHKTLK